MHIIHVV